MTDTPKVSIAGKDYGLRTQNLALLKEMAPLRTEFSDVAAQLDRLDAEVSSTLSRMAAFADGPTPEGESSDLGDLENQQARLCQERDDAQLRQFEVRLSMAYAQIADAPDEDAFMEAVGVSELAVLEEAIDTARPTSTSAG